MARFYEEVLVVTAKRPNPGMAHDIIKIAKKQDSMIIEILFDPEARAFKIMCETSHAAAARAIVDSLVAEKLALNGQAFLGHHAELKLDDYDHVRFPEPFAALPFRATLNLANDPSTPQTLANVMSNCGYDNTEEGCKIFEKRTKTLISCNMPGTIIYFGAKTQAGLTMAMCIFQFFSEGPMKSRSSSGSKTVATSRTSFGKNMPNDVAAAIQLWVTDVESHRNPNKAGRSRGTKKTNHTPGPTSGWRKSSKDKSDRMPTRRSAPVAQPTADRAVHRHVGMSRTQVHAGSSGYPDIVETWGFEIRGTKSGPKGRSLHATRSFTPGALIGQFPPPTFASPPSTTTTTTRSAVSNAIVLPATASRTSTCNHCFAAAGRTLKRCTACRSVAYCGAACQKAHWALIHGRECKPLRRAGMSALAAVSPPSGQPGRAGSSSTTLPDGAPLPAFCRAAMQVLLRPDLYGAVETELEGHVGGFEARREAWLNMEVPGRVVPSFVRLETGIGTTEADVRRVVEIMCKIQTNAFSRADDPSGSDGIFLHPTLAMVNHSCVPNATVTFSGRKAFLRALRDIKPGEEIEVSYIDCQQPLARRKRDLDLYFFECGCLRCKHDMDNYQVAMRAPASVIGLNAVSLAPDLDKTLRALSADGAQKRKLAPVGDDILPRNKKSTSPTERRRQLQRAYAATGVAESGPWALAPVPDVLSETVGYYADRGNFEAALAVACLAAVESDPFRFVEPFDVQRLKGCMSVATVLTNTAPNEGELGRFARRVGNAVPLAGEDLDVFDKLDQLSLCQMVLLLIVRWAPLGHSEEWEVYRAARETLAEIESLEGRERENGLIKAWNLEPTEKQMVEFFDFGVIKPVRALARLGKAVLALDFGLDKDLCVE
ncbi:hypothetical protein ACRALDRAFT_1080656 [Sodiomyces alcalophilus JCM 7366]|uniref:uncharacterized protein n=1 Tax=Sodiomyces alcalophilus JCM 7366 TaxID=591952 RepID=UPI0039B51BC3